MELERLLLRQYRNYEECEIQWHPRLNLITGDNAKERPICWKPWRILV